MVITGKSNLFSGLKQHIIHKQELSYTLSTLVFEILFSIIYIQFVELVSHFKLYKKNEEFEDPVNLRTKAKRQRTNNNLQNIHKKLKIE